MTFLGWLIHLRAVQKRKAGYPETKLRYWQLYQQDIINELERQIN